MEIHFSEKQLEISKDFKEKNEKILDYLQLDIITHPENLYKVEFAVIDKCKIKEFLDKDNTYLDNN